MVIFKESLPEDTLDLRKTELPAKTGKDAAGLILHIGMQYGSPMMWYQADADEEKNEFTILAIGTGHSWGESLTRENYIGTLSLNGGTLILHYFIVEGDLIRKMAEHYEQEKEGNDA